MSNELEDFLARILQSNAEKKQSSKLPPRPIAPHANRGAPPSMVNVEVVDDLDVISAEVVSERPAEPRRLRSTTDLSSLDISDHAERLGHKFDTPKKSHVGEEVESHLAHKVGRLASTAVDPYATKDNAALDAAPLDIAEQIAKMLQTPEGLRQAVILQEVLRRPEHLW